MALPLAIAWLACVAAHAQTANDAAALIRDGKAADAIPILEKLVAQTPDDQRARNLLGIALSSAARHEEAIAQFRKVLEQNPQFLPAVKNLAMDELQLGRDADARTHFETALRSVPNDPAIHLGLAQLEYRAHRFELARQHFEQTGDLYRQTANTLTQYAESCEKTGNRAKAASAHFEAGLALAKLAQYEPAARQFAMAKGEGTDPYEVGFNLTLAYFNAKNYAASIEAANELTGRGLANAELYSLLAKAYEASGRTKDAYDALRSAVRLNPREENAYLELVALCVEHENYDLAIEIADIGLRMNPQAFRIRVARGVVLALTGRMEQAEKEFANAAKAAPGETLSYLARSIVLMEMNRLPQAIEILRSRTDGGYQVQWRLAEALIRSGSADAEAIRALRKSIELNPLVARTHFLLGKLTGSVEELETALRLDPDDVSAAYQLAQAYRKKGDSVRASELFAKVSSARADAAEKQAGRGALLRIVRDGSK